MVLIVSYSSALTVSLGNDTSICGSTSLTLNAGNTGSSYMWSTGATTQTLSVNTSGDYSVTVSNNGCSAIDTINVNYTEAPLVSLGNDTSLCGQPLITINAGNLGCSYLWSTNATTQTIDVAASGNYAVSVTCGDCPLVKDDINISISGEATSLYIPNTFTPDKNGKNDVFKPIGEGVTNYNLKIFDRWGEQLFESTDINTGWDGTYKGRLAQPDNYVWNIEYMDACSKKMIKKLGNVLLMK